MEHMWELLYALFIKKFFGGKIKAPYCEEKTFLLRWWYQAVVGFKQLKCCFFSKITVKFCERACGKN